MASIDRTLKDLEFLREILIPRMEGNLRWAKNARYHRLRVNDSAKVKVSGAGDPTGEIATGDAQQRMRSAIRIAQEKVKEIVKEFESADGVLEASFRKADAYRPVTDKPPLVSEGELEEARQAKRRREARGEGYGEA